MFSNFKPSWLQSWLLNNKSMATAILLLNENCKLKDENQMPLANRVT